MCAKAIHSPDLIGIIHSGNLVPSFFLLFLLRLEWGLLFGYLLGKEFKVWQHGQLWDADGRRSRRRRRCWVSCLTKMKDVAPYCFPSLSVFGSLSISLCESSLGERLYPWGSAGGNTNKLWRLLPLCGSVLCWRDGFVPSPWACQLRSPFMLLLTGLC